RTMKKAITAIMTKSRGFMENIYQSFHDLVKMIIGASATNKERLQIPVKTATCSGNNFTT
ncbi:MAG: hypothetical protein ACNYWU_07900, partial [Desulfobacterales bacterium]